MSPPIIVLDQPGIEIGLQLVDAAIDLLAECHPIERLQEGGLEALADAIRLRAFGLGAAAEAAEAKHVTGERILPEHCLRLRRQAVDPLAHVGGARQPYPGACRQTVHRSRSITCRSVSALTSPRKRTRAPQPNAISMTPSRSVRRGRSPSGAIST